MRLSEFDYYLPERLIAQSPLKERDAARMMVVDREEKKITESVFSNVINFLNKGDCLVLNDTKVLPVRLFGKRVTGGRVEVFVLNPYGEKIKALIRPSKRIKENEIIELDGGGTGLVGGDADVGRFIEFSDNIESVLKNGHVPLPPYISRDDSDEDKEAYQTVYASSLGATASPTAGLHFTENLLEKIKVKGVKVVYVTLHTSYGTFAPVKEENIENHVMHSEYYEINKKSADIVNNVKAGGGKVLAVGTTSLRVLESASKTKNIVEASSGHTNLFIYPGYKVKIIDGMITNFHLPKSTLLMLVSAVAGKDLIFDAYNKAIESGFRFFSYGDAMLII